MAEFVDVPVEIDAQTLQDEALSYLEAELPGWQPSAGNVEVVLTEAISEMAVEQAVIAAQVPPETMRKLGELFNIVALDGEFATGTATFTATDTLGHTIEAGTFMTVDDVLFEVATDTEVPAGSSTVAIDVVAVVEGEAGNDRTGEMTLVDTLVFADSVVLTGVTVGGVDPETDQEYLDRLVSELRLLAPRPIIPEDFAQLAKRIEGVDRAVAVDGYNPGDLTYNNERMVAVAAVDEAGTAVSSTIKSEIDAYLQSLREVNFVVNMIDPTTTAIDVVVEITVLPNFDAASVLQAVEDTLADWLDPANWGRTTAVSPTGDLGSGTDWVNTSKVGYLNVAGIVRSVPGVAYIDTLTVEGGTVDVTLSGAAPLTEPGTITVTET